MNKCVNMQVSNKGYIQPIEKTSVQVVNENFHDQGSLDYCISSDRVKATSQYNSVLAL